MPITQQVRRVGVGSVVDGQQIADVCVGGHGRLLQGMGVSAANRSVPDRTQGLVQAVTSSFRSRSVVVRTALLYRLLYYSALGQTPAELIWAATPPRRTFTVVNKGSRFR